MRDHGTLQFELLDNILFVEGRGPWNKEALSTFTDNIALSRKKELLGKWGVVIHVIGDPIYTPDAVELLVKYLQYEKRHGRVATAFILTESTSPEIGKWHISEVYKQAGEECRFFDNTEQARYWLSGLLDK